jgi:DNA-binding YbaB/EbfC family protein
MFDKMMAQMKEQTEAIKKELEKTELTAEAESGLVKVLITGNKTVKDIIISESIADDPDTISDLTVIAVNRAIKKAEQLSEQKMGNMAQGMLPGLGNLLG